MKTKNIFKALAMAMLMPAMMLTTACSSEDDALNNTANTENTINKGYALPVTVNVTREGDAGTRATYTDNGDGTGSLAFSDGDKLFVYGDDNGGAAGRFAGTLEYDTESGKFSGTIYTQSSYEGTADELFKNADADGSVNATLLPAGYEDHGYLYIRTYDDIYEYNDEAAQNNTYTLATSKAAGVGQLSWEQATVYDNGFALTPMNAILNFTITGLVASTSVNVSLTSPTYNITGTVTTDASGNATFAAGVRVGTNLNDFSLTVAGNPITIVSSDKVVDAGKIYNITRSIVDLSKKDANYTASNGETLTGTLTNNVQISIADGATVILNNVTINGTNDEDYKWAGITCLGDATITLEGTNTVKGFDEDYPGIHVPEGKTLTIQGEGSLNASSNGYGAGIGGGNNYLPCGNIVINGGTVTATGGDCAAGIGGGSNYIHCGNIVINGGTVTATGGWMGAGIGSSNYGSCGAITISGGTVTATGGTDGAGIGSGETGSFDAITISGGTVTATGLGEAAGIGGGCGNTTCGTIIIKSTVTKVTATKGSDAPYSIGAGNGGEGITLTIQAGANVIQN